LHFECAGCGAVVTAVEPIEFDAPPVQAPAGLRAPARTIEPEPWYYRFLSTYANVILWLAIGAAILTLVGFGAIGALALAASPDQPSAGAICSGLIAFLALAFYVGLLLVSVLLYVAYILLAVDIGRNVREMRHLLQHRGG
jgi:hypothetical protein